MRTLLHVVCFGLFTSASSFLFCRLTLRKSGFTEIRVLGSVFTIVNTSYYSLPIAAPPPSTAATKTNAVPTPDDELFQQMYPTPDSTEGMDLGQRMYGMWTTHQMYVWIGNSMYGMGTACMCGLGMACMDWGQHVWIGDSMYGLGTACVDWGWHVWNGDRAIYKCVE